MIPLRYVVIDLTDVPLPAKRGTYMALDRAAVLSQLDPDGRYYPMDIARIALTDQATTLKHKRYQQLFIGLRQSYGNLANRKDLGTNPCLSGAEWLALLGPSLHRLAALMERLRQRQEEEPGVVFALEGEELVHYADQAVNLDHCFLNDEARAALARFQEEAVSAAAVLPKPVVDAAPTKDPLAPPTAGLTRSRRRWRWPVLILGLASVLLPCAAAWYWWQLDELAMAEVQELIAPLEGAPYATFAGRRYLVGDRVRLDGQVGVIRSIQRAGLQVGERFYDAPTLYFFGQPMGEEGNSVVYPGSPRRIAGNFNLVRSEALDRLEPGYLSWLGGFQDLSYICMDIAEVLAFLQLVSGIPMGATGHQTLAVPEDMQLYQFLETCNARGASVDRDENFIEVVWP